MSLRVLETVGERDHQHICNRVRDKPEVQVHGRTCQNRFYDTQSFAPGEQVYNVQTETNNFLPN